MKYEKGNWRVMRNCCTSGMCLECRPLKQRPIRIVQAEGYSKEYAQFVALNWARYNATIAPMAEVTP